MYINHKTLGQMPYQHELAECLGQADEALQDAVGAYWRLHVMS
jgi:hypothetical protein